MDAFVDCCTYPLARGSKCFPCCWGTVALHQPACLPSPGKSFLHCCSRLRGIRLSVGSTICAASRIASVNPLAASGAVVFGWTVCYKKFKLVQSTQVSRLQRARKLFRLGQPQSGHVILSPFFQPLYSTVLTKESTSLLPFLFRRTASNYWSTASTIVFFFAILLCHSTTHIFANFSFSVLSLIYHALTPV